MECLGLSVNTTSRNTFILIHIYECRLGLSDRIFEMHAEICMTLGSATRIEILNALRDEEKTVTEIVKKLGIRQANVSQHLAILRQRRVVTTKKKGTNIYYRVANPKIIQALDLMSQVLIEQLKESEKLTKIAVR